MKTDDLYFVQDYVGGKTTSTATPQSNLTCLMAAIRFKTKPLHIATLQTPMDLTAHRDTKTMFTLNLISIVTFMLAGGSAAAQSHATTCTAAQAQAADAAVDTLNSWEPVAAFRTKFGQCDDGSIAEGSSEAVAHLLVDQWDTLPALSGLIAKTPALRPFVLRHINSTLDNGDLEKIKQNAAHCTSSMQSLCKSIAQAATEAANAPQ